jgi:hypothetical protein|uniref:Glycosyl transferase family 25 domain-containing protein n=1 Tax=viral metagenome TaxID=1070528 RepID=A0A6C0J4H6_9ZZZZ
MNCQSILVYSEENDYKNTLAFSALKSYFIYEKNNIIKLTGLYDKIYGNTVFYYLVNDKNIKLMINSLCSFKNNKLCGVMCHVFIILKEHQENNISFFKIDTNAVMKKIEKYIQYFSILDVLNTNISKIINFLSVFNSINCFNKNNIYTLIDDHKEKPLYLSRKMLNINIGLNSSITNTKLKQFKFFNNGIITKSNHHENILYCNEVFNLCNDRVNYLNWFNFYFDKIFILSLPRRTNKTLKELNRLGIWNYELFEGFDSKTDNSNCEWNTMLMENKNSKVDKRRLIRSQGSWAILKSMNNLLVYTLDKKYSKILVLQDDTIFHNNFLEEFYLKTHEINEWKLLYLGASQHTWNNIDIVHNYYHANGTTDGAFAIGIDKSVIKELISEIRKFIYPIDSGALWEIQNRYSEECFVMYENIIIADITSSDLREKRDLQYFSKLFKWNLNNFTI